MHQLIGAHLLGGGEREASPKGAQSPQQPLLRGLQQPVAPLQRVLQRPVSAGAPVPGLAQEPRVSLEALRDLPDVQNLDARGGELDRERHPIKPGAYLGHRRAGSGRLRSEGPGRLPRSLHEQRDRPLAGIGTCA